MSAQVGAYLSALPDDHKAAPEALRALIKARLPDHLEVMSHAMPGFRQPGKGGRMVAGYAAFKVNCGYYPHSGNIVGQFAAELTGFKTTAGAISFTPAHPLPKALAVRLIDARLAEIAATGR